VARVDNRELAAHLGGVVHADADRPVAVHVDYPQRLVGSGLARRPYQHLRVVSPYFFLAQYEGDERGRGQYQKLELMSRLLEQNPGITIEIVTNSPLTSDSTFAQAVVDMDTAPQPQPTQELRERWREGYANNEPPLELVGSEEWRKVVSNPRLRIWETGLLDAVEFGGKETYGKLHAKFIIADGLGFVGTDSFDYRSRPLNNPIRFFFEGAELYADLSADFGRLVA
jgi:phosphatidylserine/phosphatidylglycerophosphate/cardiolipin synthase-like enzyme